MEGSTARFWTREDRIATERANRTDRNLLPILYLAIAIPLVVLLSYLNPPFQSPDEPNHVLRAVAVSRGVIRGHRVADDNSGANVDLSVPEVVHRFYRMGSRERFDWSKLDEARAVGWRSREKGYTPFVNTVIYPPFFYLAAVAGLRAGEAAGFSILNSYVVAKAVSGVAAVLTAALALWIAGPGTPLLFVLLSLPMGLFLFSSISQDGPMTVSAALVAALYLRAAYGTRVLSPSERVVAAVLLGALVAGRPPYFPLLALLLTPITGRHAAGWAGWLRHLMPCAGALAIAIGWIVFGAAPARVPFRIDEGVSIPGQIGYLLSEPLEGIRVILHTLRESGAFHLSQMLGVFGWSEIYLPSLVYGAIYAVLAAGIGLQLVTAPSNAEEQQRAAATWTAGAAALAMAASVPAVYLVQYLTWTPVGRPTVDGVQGRYFLPIAMFLPVALCGIRLPGGRRPYVEAIGHAVVVTFLVAIACVVPWAIWCHYYSA